MLVFGYIEGDILWSERARGNYEYIIRDCRVVVPKVIGHFKEHSLHIETAGTKRPTLPNS